MSKADTVRLDEHQLAAVEDGIGPPGIIAAAGKTFVLAESAAGLCDRAAPPAGVVWPLAECVSACSCAWAWT